MLALITASTATGATFSLTNNQATVTWGSGFVINGVGDNGNQFRLIPTLTNYSKATLSFVNVGDTVTLNLGNVRSNESSVDSSEQDNLSMSIAVILGGQTYNLSPSISTNRSHDNITFTSGANYSSVQNTLCNAGDNSNYIVRAILQWSDNGSPNWGTSQTSNKEDRDYTGSHSNC